MWAACDYRVGECTGCFGVGVAASLSEVLVPARPSPGTGFHRPVAGRFLWASGLCVPGFVAACFREPEARVRVIAGG